MPSKKNCAVQLRMHADTNSRSTTARRTRPYKWCDPFSPSDEAMKDMGIEETPSHRVNLERCKRILQSSLRVATLARLCNVQKQQKLNVPKRTMHTARHLRLLSSQLCSTRTSSRLQDAGHRRSASHICFPGWTTIARKIGGRSDQQKHQLRLALIEKPANPSGQMQPTAKLTR